MYVDGIESAVVGFSNISFCTHITLDDNAHDFSLQTVGSPHTWPSVLAMLAWLVDVVNLHNHINPVIIAFPSDFDSDVNLGKTKFTLFVELFNCDDDTEKFDAQLEVSLS